MAFSVETTSFWVALEIYTAFIEFEPDLIRIPGRCEFHVNVVLAEEDGRICELIETVRTRLAEPEREPPDVEDLGEPTKVLHVQWPLTP